MTVKSTLVQRMSEEKKHSLRRLRALPHRRNLDRLGRIYGTDKATTGHGYTTWYLRHLPPRREVRSLLEIGIGGTTSTYEYEGTAGGASLRMWRDYYTRARIVGVDIHQKIVGGRGSLSSRAAKQTPSSFEI